MLRKDMALIFEGGAMRNANTAEDKGAFDLQYMLESLSEETDWKACAKAARPTCSAPMPCR